MSVGKYEITADNSLEKVCRSSKSEVSLLTRMIFKELADKEVRDYT